VENLKETFPSLKIRSDCSYTVPFVSMSEPSFMKETTPIPSLKSAIYNSRKESSQSNLDTTTSGGSKNIVKLETSSSSLSESSTHFYFLQKESILTTSDKEINIESITQSPGSSESISLSFSKNGQTSKNFETATIIMQTFQDLNNQSSSNILELIDKPNTSNVSPVYFNVSPNNSTLLQNTNLTKNTNNLQQKPNIPVVVGILVSLVILGFICFGIICSYYCRKKQSHNHFSPESPNDPVESNIPMKTFKISTEI
jgi:hypothetical protein